MTQEKNDRHQVSKPQVNITDEDVERMVDSYLSAHPESSSSNQIEALKDAIRHLEQNTKVLNQQSLNIRQLTNIATALSGAGALGLFVTALVPELPILTIGASIAGLVVNNLLTRVVDKAQK